MDPGERRLSGVVGGLLWIGGGLCVLATHAFGGAPHRLPMAAALCAAGLAMAWGVASMAWLDWEDGPAWREHFTAAGGLVLLTAVMLRSGGVHSISWMYFIWLGLYGCFFFRRRAALAFGAACLFAQALPLLLHPGAAWAAGDVWRVVLDDFGFAVVGGAVIHGKTTLMTLRRRAERAADTDVLTGLANHRGFDRALDRASARHAAQGIPFALVVIDVDHFKSFGRTFGIEGVEAALRQIAAALRVAARPSDSLARTGGDEFSWLLPGANAETALERLDIARATLAAGGALLFSAGVADSTQATDPAVLTRFAEGALYWSKVRGRGRALVYDPLEMDVLSAQERAEMLASTQELIGLRALARAIDAKDPATQRHSERVAQLAEALARQLGWDEPRVRALRDAALVHDVGKIGVEDAILHKTGPLTPEERCHINLHADRSADIVDGVLSAEQVEWIRTHHERPDGTGYPRGLREHEIPLGGRLLAVADAWDVMTVGRPYRSARDAGLALAECRAGVGRQFSAEAVAALAEWLERDAATAATAEPKQPAEPSEPVPAPAAQTIAGAGAGRLPALVSAHAHRREP